MSIIKDVNYDSKDMQKKTGPADYVGTTISDSVATSTQAETLSNNTNLFNSNKSIRQVIYAGSDVTVTGDANFKLTLYGYAMDLIKPEDGTNDMLPGTGRFSPSATTVCLRGCSVE